MTKPSLEERLVELERRNADLEKIVLDSQRKISDYVPSEPLQAITFDQGTPAYPTAPANVFPMKIRDIRVDTSTIGNQAVTIANRSDDVVRNVYSSEFLTSGTEITVIEHLGHYFAIRGGGGGVVLIRGRSVGVIAAGASGDVDNIEVWIGSFTVSGPSQTQGFTLPTDAFDTKDNAWVWLIKKDDGSFGVMNAECL